ncbi:baseplate assembly protein [Mesorhizobium sp. NBSH29]|nr:baseplate assembly protein [Mesorhizobium sp. NBSH29]
MDRSTWMPLVGWDHVLQSIEVILTTEIGERLHRRNFGSTVTDLIDKPQTIDTIVDLYMAVAESLEPRVRDGAQLGEPRFLLTSVALAPSADGTILINVRGDYYPNGHLGDFTLPLRDRAINIPVGAAF